jgi:hypothetical protein
MKDFKFLSKNDTINFNGQMSIEALRYFNDYVNNVIRYEITTTTATYKMVDYTYGDGNIVAGTVNAYPLEASNIVVTYTIRGGEITSHTIHIDYWNTMGQMINTLRETQ